MRPAFSLFCAMIALVLSPRTDAADDILQRTRALYGELRSYADTGTVINEYGTSGTDRHKFTTAFVRVPRGFLLDFKKQGGEHYVIWGDPGAFHTWLKTTGQRFDYPNPNNAGAISLSGQNTIGASGKIPTLLYSKAALGGDFANFAVAVDGTEFVDGHRCHRLRGRASDAYAATGREVNARSMTVWIDAESLLIRKVLEEWVPLPGQRSRVITIYEPEANPTLDESRVVFTPPAIR
jgi:outer membrane lipoprotein-sorting protein